MLKGRPFPEPSLHSAYLLPPYQLKTSAPSSGMKNRTPQFSEFTIRLPCRSRRNQVCHHTELNDSHNFLRPIPRSGVHARSKAQRTLKPPHCPLTASDEQEEEICWMVWDKAYVTIISRKQIPGKFWHTIGSIVFWSTANPSGLFGSLYRTDQDMGSFSPDKTYFQCRQDRSFRLGRAYTKAYLSPKGSRWFLHALSRW
jgi:hypothetical protein